MTKRKGAAVIGKLDLPWLTDRGLDMTKLPLEWNYQTVLGADRQQSLGSLSVIESATAYGRTEAGVFLMGLLLAVPPQDWEFRIAVARALRHTKTSGCAQLLLSEIQRLESSNTTRRYIVTILDVLRRFPAELVLDGLEDLSRDPRFGSKMRQRILDAADAVAGRHRASVGMRSIDLDGDWE